MNITAKVGSLLGKRQKSQEPSFGEPLDLGHIALANENSSQESSSETMDSESMPNTDQTDQAVEKMTSILDLDFMSAPLAEIELVQQREKESNTKAETGSELAESPNTPVETRQKAAEQNISAPAPEVRSVPQPQPFNPVSTPLPSMPPEEAREQASLAKQPPMTQDVENQTELSSATAVESALAQSMRGNSEAGFMVFSPNGDCVDFCEAFAAIIGMSKTDISKITSYNDMLAYMSIHADLGGKDVATLGRREAQSMKGLLAKGASKTLRWKTTMKSGKILEFSNNYTLNNHLVTRVKDVTDKVEKSRLLRIGLKLGTAGYWSYSFRTGKSTLSEYMTQKLSASELQRVETEGIISLIHADDAKRVQDTLNSSIKNRSRMDCEFRVVLEGGNTSIMRMIGEVEISRSSGKPEVFVAYLNDLTEDKKKSKELTEIKELSKNRSEFLARMSHEIKTPLNAIVGMTDALRDEVDNDEARETASFIADAAENLNNILSQTLEHERLSTSEIMLEEDVVDLAEVIKSSVAMWKKPCADKQLKLDVRISPNLPNAIKIDRSRFRQCLTNLLSNAVKFTSEGRIVVAVTPMNADSAQPSLLVAVQDTGIGMSPKAVQNIFKPFHQADTSIHRRFGGSGLGMSITQHIVKAMNGNIKVQSVPEKGTTIAITIPLLRGNAVDAAPTASAPVKETVQETVQEIKSKNIDAEVFHPYVEPAREQSTDSPQSPSGSNVRKHVPIVPSDYSGFDVLIVEDNPVNQAVVRKLLSNHIRSMEFAFHGGEALEILETKTFDVILMDIHMPVKDGIETTLEIRNSGKAWADTVIVALTADPDYQQKRVCRNIGMNDALSKPVKRQELLDVLQKVLNDRVSSRNLTSVAS